MKMTFMVTVTQGHW